MAFEVSLRCGNPDKMDYTPSSDVAAGQVIVVGNVPGIADVPIPANKLDSLCCGGGIFRATCDAAIAAGKVIYWNDTTNQVTETAGGNKVIGYTVSASANAGDPIDFYHAPRP